LAEGDVLDVAGIDSGTLRGDRKRHDSGRFEDLAALAPGKTAALGRGGGREGRRRGEKECRRYVPEPDHVALLADLE
jgi:hypothetical protein